MTIGLSEHFTYRKLLRFVLPCIAMMLMTSIYSIVDGFFLSNFAGKNAFAAVNLVMPVIMGLGTFGFMIGTGGSALVAFTLGRNEERRANEIFSMLIYAAAAGGAILAVAGFILMPHIAGWMGATPAIQRDCVLYGRISMCSLIFFMLQISFQSFLVAAERAKMGLVISVSAGCTNIVLDFVLVYLFRLGVVGASSATACAELLGGMIPLIYFLRKNESRLQLVRTRFSFRVLLKASSNGVSELLSNLSASIVGILYNAQLMRLAAEDGVAAYGVLMYVSFVFVAFFLGYAMGVNPVVGYHYGAQNRPELRNILKKSLAITGVAAVCMCSLAQLFSMPIAKIFVGYDPALCEMTSNAMHLYFLAFLLNGFNIFGSAFFTGLNNGRLSALISVSRTLVFQVAAILILPQFLGIRGVWLAVVTAEILTLCVTLTVFFTNRKRYGYF